VYTTSADSVSQTEYGTFENYAFVLGGKVIPHKTLVNYPGAILNRVSPYTIKFGANEYRGVVYFIPAHYAAAVPYANDPAWFINGTQVSPFDICSSRPEVYQRISKSVHDTVINGTRYKGSIHVDTDEDFLAERIALSDLLEKRTDLLLEEVIVNWRSPNTTVYRDGNDIGTIIRDHFSIYHIDTSQYGLQAVKVDRLQFAEGDRYVVHLLDNRYTSNLKQAKWFESEKAQSIFEDPLAVDINIPCYLAGLDTSTMDIFNSVELPSEPYGGKELYLEKLSSIMGLPNQKSAELMISDSITVRFILTKSAMLTRLESIGLDKRGHAQILEAIKRNSCTWSAGIHNGRPQPLRRKMTIFYSKDQNGNIQSLDTLEYQ